MSESINKAWDRRANETLPAYEAFRAYLRLGTDRSLVKASQVLGKSTTLLSRWSCRGRHDWVRRAHLFDMDEAHAINAGLDAGSGEMLQRHVAFGMKLAYHADTRIRKMSDAEFKALTPREVASFFRVGVNVEMKARNIPQRERDLAERDDPPTIQINFLRGCPAGMTPVRFADDDLGYIPDDRIDECLRDYPDAVAIR
jgi:hypothetical protein